LWRPSLLFLDNLLLGLALDRGLPPPLNLPDTAAIQRIAGGGLILLGIAIAHAGFRNVLSGSNAVSVGPANTRAGRGRDPRLERRFGKA
jgi:hypothetical protein